MKNSFSQFQYVRRLQSLKTADIKAKQQIKSLNNEIESTHHDLLQKEKTSSEQNLPMNLQQVVTRIKINSLVSQFIYKLKRNSSFQEPIEYEKIRQTLSKRKSHEQYIRTLQLSDRLVAIFMILNIFAILFIQTLSAFQGFYLDYAAQDSRRPAIILIELICLAIFFIKLVFSFFSSYSVNGVREKYIRYVAKYYLFSWLFVFDFLNFVMTLFKIIFPSIQITGILCFSVTVLALPVISKDFQVIQIVFFTNFRRRQYFNIFKIFMFNIFFAQFVSSIFMAISYWDLSDNWIQKAISAGVMLPGQPWWHTYFYSMYWAITTLTTIGYGDITPSNYFEVAFVGIIMLFGTALLSYNLSQIGSVISNLRSIDKRRKEQIVIFKRMSKDQKVSQDLQANILDYINKSAEVRAEFQFDQRKQFLDNLPSQLREDFQSEYATKIFEKISFFNLLQTSTLINLSMKLNGQILYPGESITKKDGTLSSVMFLKHGRVGFAYQKPGSILNGLILQKRQINRDRDSPYLLNKFLLTADRDINYQIVAENYCFLLILEYNDFYESLRQNKKDNQFYFSLYSRISYIDQEWDRFQCRYCAPKRHTVFICPKLHYMPYKSVIVQRITLGPLIEQSRKPIFNRKDYDLKQKSALKYWKDFHQFVEIQFSAGYGKKTDEKDLQGKNKNDDMTLKIAEQVLRIHCCDLRVRRAIQESSQLDIDQMRNFRYFFPQCNPSNLIMLNLKLSEKLKIRVPVRF